MAYEPRFHVVLHQPDIPPNTGNVARTCVALEAKLWLVRPLGFQVDDRSVRRAGLDYWPHLEWEVVDDWAQLQEKLGPVRMWFFTIHGKRLYTEAEFQPDDVLVFGSETTGLPKEMLAEHAASTLKLPQSSFVRSLNLSNTVAVAAYELRRQLTVSMDA